MTSFAQILRYRDEAAQAMGRKIRANPKATQPQRQLGEIVWFFLRRSGQPAASAGHWRDGFDISLSAENPAQIEVTFEAQHLDDYEKGTKLELIAAILSSAFRPSIGVHTCISAQADYPGGPTTMVTLACPAESALEQLRATMMR